MIDLASALHAYLTQAHDETWPVLTRLGPEDLETEIYSGEEAGWKVRDVLAHLADAERGLLGQIRRMVAGGQTVPNDFDLNRWNRSAVRKRAGRTPEELLDELQQAHEEVLAFLSTLQEKDFDHVGRHASGEMLSTEGYFRRMADHRREHVSDISRALGGSARRRTP
ncbi:MAG TPA: maleylpyruvate isomerase N-terminal domain-containing protein [Anaerolineales bacterium]|nr:maleylpyruvate isomerase N-terminal domain-containing protein [Anaerolineales bacterium]